MVGLWLQVAAYLTWAVCGIPGLLRLADGTLPFDRAAVFAVAFPAFAVAFALANCGVVPERRRALRIGLVAVQSVSGLATVWASRHALPAAMLVIAAAGVPHVLGGRRTGVWIAAQSLALAGLFGAMFGPLEAAITGGAFAGFQLFAVSTASLALSQMRARMELARANAELTATRELLAENSRVAERLRISRDLHDTLGHHLTALSIQLEVASRLTDGPAAEHVRQAHAVARLLLGDVRSVVSEMRASGRVDVSQALRALAEASGSLRIHLDVPERLDIDDAAQGHALVRCVQEIITNTARHAAARNLWITVAQRPDGIDLHARDDGRGAPALHWGNGLRGMKERFDEYAGRIEFRSAAGQGFEVRGFLPRAETA